MQITAEQLQEIEARYPKEKPAALSYQRVRQDILFLTLLIKRGMMRLPRG